MKKKKKTKEKSNNNNVEVEVEVEVIETQQKQRKRKRKRQQGEIQERIVPEQQEQQQQPQQNQHDYYEKSEKRSNINNKKRQIEGGGCNSNDSFDVGYIEADDEEQKKKSNDGKDEKYNDNNDQEEEKFKFHASEKGEDDDEKDEDDDNDGRSKEKPKASFAKSSKKVEGSRRKTKSDDEISLKTTTTPEVLQPFPSSSSSSRQSVRIPHDTSTTTAGVMSGSGNYRNTGSSSSRSILSSSSSSSSSSENDDDDDEEEEDEDDKVKNDVYDDDGKRSKRKKKRKVTESKMKTTTKTKTTNSTAAAASGSSSVSSTLRVVAPEQPIPTIMNRKGLGISFMNEYMDDFDIIENENDDMVDDTNDDNVLLLNNDSDNYSKQQQHDDDDDDDSNNNKNAKTCRLLSLNEQEINKAMELSKEPIIKVAESWGLAPFLIENLITASEEEEAGGGREQSENEEEEEDRRFGFKNFFLVQCLVIPHVINTECQKEPTTGITSFAKRTRDICVSAPTGSGKTLSFVLPILHCLYKRRICRLRALIVLPSRDLAKQVYNVFQTFAIGSKLRIGLLIGGQTNFDLEQRDLIICNNNNNEKNGDEYEYDDVDTKKIRYSYEPQYNVNSAIAAYDGTVPLTTCTTRTRERSKMSLSIGGGGGVGGGRSAVDILVATPGRLMDHIKRAASQRRGGSGGGGYGRYFTLQHLRFLVIDEADRLLNQSYQNWIEEVCKAAATGAGITATEKTFVPTNDNETAFIIDPITMRDDEYSTTTSTTLPLRKLLFSATMTRDPQKLSILNLIHPKHYNAHHHHHHHIINNNESSSKGQNQQHQKQRYTLPSTLSEYIVECKAPQKPLVLLSLLLEQEEEEKKKNVNKSNSNSNSSRSNKNITAVFTSSVDSTHRLTRLLQLLWMYGNYGKTNSIAEFSSRLNHKQRTQLLRRCCSPPPTPLSNSSSSSFVQKQQDPISVIVCSDGMARGMDINTISTVIHYDVPSFAKTYVHRCGRTARAGQIGKTITILKDGQRNGIFRYIHTMIDHFHNHHDYYDNDNGVGGGNNGQQQEEVKTWPIRKDLIHDINCKGIYAICVKTLRDVIKDEDDGVISPIVPLYPQDYMDMDNNNDDEDEDKDDGADEDDDNDKSDESV